MENINDTLYDFEVLENLTTIAFYIPDQKYIEIGYNTYFEKNEINKDENLIDLTEYFKTREDELKDYIFKVNKDDFKQFDITSKEQIVFNNNIEDSCNKLIDIANKKGMYKHTNKNKADVVILGYNSSRYDIPILASIIGYAKDNPNINHPIPTNDLRKISDDIIIKKKTPFSIRGANSDELLYPEGSQMQEMFYYLNYHQSFLDIMPINESTGGKMPLKRLVAQAGEKILTSDLLTGKESQPIKTFEELAEFLAYNVSDNFGTIHIYQDEAYQEPLHLKTQLYKRYKDEKFQKAKKIKRDSTNPTFIEYIIAPNGGLKDDPELNLGYPITRNYFLHIIKEFIPTNLNKTNLDIQVPDYIYEDSIYYESYIQEQFINTLLKMNNTYTDTEIMEQLETLMIKKPEYRPLFLKNYKTYDPIEKKLSDTWYTIKNKKFKLKYDRLEDIQIIREQFMDYYVYKYAMQFKKNSNLELKKELFNNEETESRILNDIIDTEIIRNEKTEYIDFEYTFYKELFTSPKTKKSMLQFKDNELMIDLLEYIEYHYEVGDKKYDYDHQRDRSFTYMYYDALRGNNLKTRESRKEILEKNYFKENNLSDGVTLTMPNNIPAYITMTYGGLHGNYIDLNTYQNQRNQYNLLKRKRKQIIEFYKKKFEMINPKDSIYEIANEASYKITKKQESDMQKEPYNKYDNTNLEKYINFLMKMYEKYYLKHKKYIFIYDEPSEIQEFIKSEFKDSNIDTRYKLTKNAYFTTFKKQPKLKLAKDYTQSIDVKNSLHVDIASYYPTLITILKIFKTDSGVDEYAKLLQERLDLKAKLPDLPPSMWTDEDFLNNLYQLMNKHMLNSASGKLDMGYDNKIRLNNKALRMRICGQLILLVFALEISKKDGVPNSSNTDGIFTHNMQKDQLDFIINQWTTLFQLDAESEVIDHFYSKDSNSRLEIIDNEIKAAGGNELATYKGSNLVKSIARPPITSMLFAKYLLEKDNAITTAFDRELARKILKEMIDEVKENPYEITNNISKNTKLSDLYTNLQHISVSNPSKDSYIIFKRITNNKWIYTGPINRLFYIDPELRFMINERKVIAESHPYVIATNIKQNKQIVNKNQECINILDDLNISTEKVKADKSVGCDFYKNSTIDDYTFIMSNLSNRYLDISILDALDLDAYIDITESLWLNYSENAVLINNIDIYKQGGWTL